MVLSPPAAQPEQAQVAAWLGPILRGLRLIGSGGILLLVDNARPGALPLLLRRLLPLYPDVDVLHGVAGLDWVPDGGVVVLCPREEEAEWMNLHRPLFERRALKVVLWSDRATTPFLRKEAPDFFDWISHRVECPQMAPPHAVRGLKALVRARVAGCTYGDASFLAAVAEAFPGRGLRSVSAERRYSEMVETIKGAGRDLLLFTGAHGVSQVRRVRWALAEARWKRPSLLHEAEECPGWWRLHGTYLLMDEGAVRLAGAGRPGLVAGLCGMEPEAIDLCAQLLGSAGREEAQLLELLLAAADPGAALAQEALAAGIVDLGLVEAGSATSPLLRGLWRHPQVRLRHRARRARLLRGETAEDAAIVAARLDPGPPARRLGLPPGHGAWYVAELVLRRGPRDAAAWRWLAETAREVGDLEVAAEWVWPRLQGAQVDLDDPDLVLDVLAAAGSYRARGRFGEAEPLYLRALDILDSAGADREILKAVALGSLAGLREAQGRYVEAEPLYLRALGILEQRDDAGALLVTEALNNLGGLYRALGRYVEAEPLLLRALALLDQRTDPLRTATILDNLAGLYQSLGRDQEAEPLFRRALAISEQVLQPDHPEIADQLGYLARFLAGLGRFREAEPLVHRALAIREKALGPEHPAVARSLGLLAGLHLSQARFDDAERVLRRALDIIEKGLGPEHLDAAVILDQVAELRMYQGRHREIEPLLQRVLAIRERALGPNHPELAQTLEDLAELYRTLREPERAEPLEQRARSIRKTAPGS